MATDDEPDEWLMAQVALGKRECLKPLVGRYAGGLLTFIERMVGNRHRSEELFQDVFLAVWTHSRRYHYPRPFKTWLWGIAVKKCQGDLRKQAFWSGRLTGDSTALTSGGPTPIEVAIQCETAVVIAEAVAQIPPAQRMVLVLKIWNGLSYEEIAEITGRTESTVRSHMFHALASIRNYLEPRMR